MNSLAKSYINATLSLLHGPAVVNAKPDPALAREVFQRIHVGHSYVTSMGATLLVTGVVRGRSGHVEFQNIASKRTSKLPRGDFAAVVRVELGRVS